MSPTRSLLLGLTVSLHLFATLSAAFPLLHTPSLSTSLASLASLSRRSSNNSSSVSSINGTAIVNPIADAKAEHELPPHIVALICSFAIIGSLLLSAMAMTLCLWCRRRRRGRRGRRRTYTKSNRASTATVIAESTADGSGKRPLLALASQCSWCYIAESKVCKWCAGEAEDVCDNKSDSLREGLYVSCADLKYNGWRSVLHTPAPSRTRSPAAPRSPERSFGSLSSLSTICPGGSTVAKKSFRPSGVYEVHTKPLPEYPSAVVVRVVDEIRELKR